MTVENCPMQKRFTLRAGLGLGVIVNFRRWQLLIRLLLTSARATMHHYATPPVKMIYIAVKF